MSSLPKPSIGYRIQELVTLLLDEGVIPIVVVGYSKEHVDKPIAVIAVPELDEAQILRTLENCIKEIREKTALVVPGGEAT